MKMIQSDCVSTVKLSGKSFFGAGSKMRAAALALIAGFSVTVQAGKIYVPNFSFESPVAPTNLPYATPQMDEWQVTPQPADYNPDQQFRHAVVLLVGDLSTTFHIQGPTSRISTVCRRLFCWPTRALEFSRIIIPLAGRTRFPIMRLTPRTRLEWLIR